MRPFSYIRGINSQKGLALYESTNNQPYSIPVAKEHNHRSSCMGLAPMRGMKGFLIQTISNNKYTIRNSASGFTLIEALISIALLLIVIVGPMSIASRGMQNSFYAGDQTTAIFLAQEAIEHIQSLRDDNALANVEDYNTQGNDKDGDTWNWYTSGPTGGTGWANCKNANGCDIEIDSGPGYDYKNCGTISQCRLEQRDDPTASSIDRVYGYGTTGWSSSPYTRVIKLGNVINDGLGNPMAVPVTVTVTWNASLFGGDRSVVLQTYLYNQYSRLE